MPIRWGIIGCGEVTEVKSGPALQYAQDSHLVAVMRRDAEKVEDYARRHGVPRWYTDADALIADPEVDAVYVATPPGSHLEYALRACAAGKPVYVEKPMARSYRECTRMIEAFKKAGVKLFVAYYRRALDRFLKVKEIIDTGKIGLVTGITYRYIAPQHRALEASALPWRVVASESGGGLFLDLGCHLLDLLDFLLGPLEAVSGLAANRASPCQVEDTVAMHFKTGEGAPGTASWNFAGHTGHAPEDRLEICGTDGRITVSVFGVEPVLLSTRRGEESFAFTNPYRIQQPLIQTVVNELLERGTCPSTGESAARTSLVMDRVLSDYYRGRDDEFWLRPETWQHR